MHIFSRKILCIKLTSLHCEKICFTLFLLRSCWVRLLHTFRHFVLEGLYTTEKDLSFWSLNIFFAGLSIYSIALMVLAVIFAFDHKLGLFYRIIVCWILSSNLVVKILCSLLHLLHICKLLNILCFCDVSCIPLINLRRINSSYVVMSFIFSSSNTQYLDASFNLCIYLIYLIDSFGSRLMPINFVLLATTRLFVVYFS